ncbi:MAG: hypothetical protein KBS59_06845, partial [Clostridiales bacterium]|nr:hypothetical protein [Clostridiales bacterium]
KNIRKVIDFSDETYTAKEAKKWQQERHEIKLSNGKTVTMTTAQLMAFYCTSKRQQALEHLTGGGIHIADINEDVAGRLQGRKSIRQTEPYHLTTEDIQALNAELLKDKRAVEVADKLQKYMGTYGARLGNEVSMARFGIKQFGEENYFPITSDMNNLLAINPEAKENDIFRLLNMSMTKGLVKDANNAIVISDIFEVFSKHMEDMTKYNALALPVLDIIKWYNFNDRTKDANGQITTRNVKKAIERAYGNPGKSYVLNFIKDINGANNGGRGTGILNAFIGNAKVAAVGANLRVAILQPTSYTRAAAVLPMKYLLEAEKYAPRELIGRNGWKEALRYSGLAQWKDLGFYDTNIGRRLSEQIMHTETVKDAAVEKMMIPAEYGDQITWGKIWYACKLEQQAKGYTGEALLEKTAERFDEVIVKTQVMDSTLTRSDIMRSKDGLAKTATSFMSESTLSLNILMEQWDRVSEDIRRGLTYKDAVIKNGKGIFRGVGAVVLGSIVSALAESLADAVRDDDDDKFADKFLKALLGDPSKSGIERFYDSNIGSDISIANKIPALRNLSNAVLGYSSSDMTSTFIEDGINAINALKSDKKTVYGKAYAIAQALSSTSGIPVSNAMRDAVAIYNTAVQALGYPELKFRKTEGKYQQLYYAMDKNNGANIKKEIQKLIDGGTEAKTIKGQITKTYKSEYLAGDAAQKKAIRQAMIDTGIYGSVSGVDKAIENWLK